MRAAITGAATGIGAATVDKLKERDYEIVAFDIAQPPGADHWIRVDMSDSDAIDTAVRQVSGSFDCLINNAGLPPREGLAHTILGVNYLGMVQMTNALIPMLNKGAAIVNTASRAGGQWRRNIDQVRALLALEDPGYLSEFIRAEEIDHIRAYNLSKEAVIAWGMTQTERLISLDLRMNSVSPAAVSTGILKDFTKAFGPAVAKNVERVGRPGLPEEIADVIMFLISRQSGWIKGQDIVIDGGMSSLAIADELTV
ncbi:MAG: SDR family oxidoreductase [Stappiaceae bacterium]